jgi:hypothetical protein
VAGAGHVPADRRRDVEVRGDGFGHWAQEVLEWHVEARCAFDVVVGRGADVDGAAGRGDSVGVLLDRGPVEDVEACEVGGAAVSPDPQGDRGSDRSGGSVDDRGLLSSSMCPPFVE